MMKFYKVSICLVLLLSYTLVNAGNSDRIGESGAFELLINPHARTMGMLGINSASVRGVDALGTNVAGLAYNKGLSVFSNYVNWLAGTETSIFSLGIANEISPGNNLGFSIGYLSYGDIPQTTTINPEPLSTFTPFYLNLGLSYSRVFGRGVRAGITGRLINESINNLSATGFAIDAGMQYTTGQKEDFHFGVFVRNLGFPMKFEGEGLILNRPVPAGNSQYDLPFYNRAAKFELPTQFSIAVTKDLFFGNQPNSSSIYCKPKHRLSISSSFVYNAFIPNNYGLGFEYSFREQLSLRAGFLYEDNALDKDATKRAHMGAAAGISYDLKLGNRKSKNPSVLEISYNYRPSWVFAGTHNLGFTFFTSRHSYCDEFVARKKAAPIVEKAKETKPKKPVKPAKPKIKYVTKYDTIIKYAPAKVNTAAKVKKINEILKDFASNIEFRTATAILTDRGEGALMVIGNLIKKYPNSKFLIEGHTDSDGNAANNMRLSKLRAKTVARYLSEFKGIPSKNMVVKWYGQDKPVASNNTASGKQINRRVEVKILDAKSGGRPASKKSSSSTKRKSLKNTGKIRPKRTVKSKTKTSEVPRKSPAVELKEYSNTIRFKAGTDTLSRVGKRSLRNVANLLKDNPDLKIRVESHTDNLKRKISNMALSENMAKAVIAQLKAYGIATTRLTYKAFGDTKPKDTNASNIGKANNLRIGLKLVK